MRRNDLGDLNVFLAVAEEQSFTKAAARLGQSQSSLSQTIRRLEERLGMRLLTRTTRSVATTEAGEQLIETLKPALSDVEARLAMLSELKDKPSGSIRLTAERHAAETILWPAISRLVQDYPEVKVEVAIDASFTDSPRRWKIGSHSGSVGPDMQPGAPPAFLLRSFPATTAA